MRIESITRKGKGLYTVSAGGREYSFSEDIIVEFRLTVGHETSIAELKEAQAQEELHSYYQMAASYSMRYNKGEAEIRAYLKEKGVSPEGIDMVVEKLKRTRVLNEDALLDSLIRSYVHNANGREMIRYKLKQKGYSSTMIEKHLNEMDEEEYFASLSRLYEKIKDKYKTIDSKTRILKIKNYLLQRGYTYSEIGNLSTK